VNLVKSIIICKCWNNNTSRTRNRYLHRVWGENTSGAELAVILQKTRVTTSQKNWSDIVGRRAEIELHDWEWNSWF